MQNGKGSKPRPHSNYNKYVNNWDGIKWNKSDQKVSNSLSERTKNKELTELSEDEFNTLKEMGYLWEFFPEATRNYKEDCLK